MNKIYIICPVTAATEEDKTNLAAYVDHLEDDGYVVWYPGRDTDQTQDGFNICLENGAAIQDADEVHVFYNSSSKGSHFDLGICFAFDILHMNSGRKFKVIEARINDNSNGHEFVNMMSVWEGLRNG